MRSSESCDKIISCTEELHTQIIELSLTHSLAGDVVVWLSVVH